MKLPGARHGRSPLVFRLIGWLGLTLAKLENTLMLKMVPTVATVVMLAAGRNAPKESILIGDSCEMRPDKEAVMMSNLSAMWLKMVAAAPERILNAPMPSDPKNQHAINVQGFGWVAVKAVRAIEQAHGIG